MAGQRKALKAVTKTTKKMVKYPGLRKSAQAEMALKEAKDTGATRGKIGKAIMKGTKKGLK
jgi:hypothetical protein